MQASGPSVAKRRRVAGPDSDAPTATAGAGAGAGAGAQAKAGGTGSCAGGTCTSACDGGAHSLPFECAPAGASARDRGRAALAWLLAPVGVDEFMSKYWERRPLVIQGRDPAYHISIMRSNDVKGLLGSGRLTYEKDVDVTRYVNNERDSRLGTGVADVGTVWPQFEEEGFSIRLLCPHAHHNPLWRLLACLEGFWGCFAGCNTYLTPSATQGFPPHCDDIEAFLLQVEGQKRWRVYAPLSEEESLPRESRQFEQAQLGEPVVDVILKPGDLLYFPRGWIHQGVCTDDSHHSFHVTLSTALHQNWSDFLELALPRALDIAARDDVAFRQSLPREAMDVLGVMNSDPDADGAADGHAAGGSGGASASAGAVPSQGELRARVGLMAQQLCMRALQYLPMDGAADQMARRFMHDRLPPVLSPEESKVLKATPGVLAAAKAAAAGDCVGAPGSRLGVSVRVLRPSLVRLAIEGDNAVVYTSMQNSRVHHDKAESRIELPLVAAVLVEALVKHAATGAAPAWVPYEHLVWQDGDSDDEAPTAPSAAAAPVDGWHPLGQVVDALACAGVVAVRKD